MEGKIKTPYELGILVLDEGHVAEREIVKQTKIRVPYRFITEEIQRRFDEGEDANRRNKMRWVILKFMLDTRN